MKRLERSDVRAAWKREREIESLKRVERERKERRRARNVVLPSGDFTAVYLFEFGRVDILLSGATRLAILTSLIVITAPV